MSCPVKEKCKLHALKKCSIYGNPNIKKACKNFGKESIVRKKYTKRTTEEKPSAENYKISYGANEIAHTKNIAVSSEYVGTPTFRPFKVCFTVKTDEAAELLKSIWDDLAQLSDNQPEIHALCKTVWDIIDSKHIGEVL